MYTSFPSGLTSLNLVTSLVLDVLDVSARGVVIRIERSDEFFT